MERAIEKKMVIGPVTVDYVHVDAPYAFKAEEPEVYSAKVIAKKGSKAHEDLIALISQCTVEGYSPNIVINEKTGDAEFVARSKFQPGVFNRDKERVDNTMVFDGAEAYVSVNAYSYVFRRDRGVSFGLRNLLLTGEGEPIIRNGAKDFDEVEL